MRAPTLPCVCSYTCARARADTTLLSTGSPSIHLVIAGVEAAAQSLAHADGAAKASAAALRDALASAGSAATRTRSAADALFALLFALQSGDRARFVFENLLLVWYAHSAMDASLRLEEADVRKLAQRPSIAAALDSNDFTRALLRQLQFLGDAA